MKLEFYHERVVMCVPYVTKLTLVDKYKIQERTKQDSYMKQVYRTKHDRHEKNKTRNRKEQDNIQGKNKTRNRKDNRLK